MSESSTQSKEDYLDWICEKFCASSRAYVIAVKEALRFPTKENAHIFERAINVLSQDFPDPTSIDEQTKEKEVSDGNEMNSLKDRIAQVEKLLEESQNKSSTLEQELKSVKEEAQNKSSTLEQELKSVKEEAQNNRSFFESQLNSEITKNVHHLDAKIGSLKNNVATLASETKDSIKELTAISNENSAHIKGRQKLQIRSKERTQAAAAAATAAAAGTPPPTAPTASALSRPFKDVRQRTNFTAKVPTDQDEPKMRDVQLLAGGRLVLADGANGCIKLFGTQGQHLYTLKCRGRPFRLALLDSSGASECHTLVVTLPDCTVIDIIEAKGDRMKIKRTIETPRRYDAVATVSKSTRAVGDWDASIIDLIDFHGRVLRQICSSVQSRYMDVTEDGGLICSTWGNKIARVQVDSGTVLFINSVPQTKDPRGVVNLSDGSILVADGSNKTLHLVSSQGIWIKKVWSAPRDTDQDDKLWGVSVDRKCRQIASRFDTMIETSKKNCADTDKEYNIDKFNSNDCNNYENGVDDNGDAGGGGGDGGGDDDDNDDDDDDC
ncbi:hypothetical protein PoB_002445100 [Plakobranchus ocellatus]|uniref:Uncharacterized protein n=1 Tax=Plakobranchus ocellatus TaxID=259542 RepID=A0AAV3ZTV3_9GAST|nr:hypothetical protein PoB_002445100 [Plakobranchus ocellatus]